MKLQTTKYQRDQRRIDGASPAFMYLLLADFDTVLAALKVAREALAEQRGVSHEGQCWRCDRREPEPEQCVMCEERIAIDAALAASEVEE